MVFWEVFEPKQIGCIGSIWYILQISAFMEYQISKLDASWRIFNPKSQIRKVGPIRVYVCYSGGIWPVPTNIQYIKKFNCLQSLVARHPDPININFCDLNNHESATQTLKRGWWERPIKRPKLAIATLKNNKAASAQLVNGSNMLGDGLILCKH